MLEEQLLDSRRHDRQAFTSGIREIDEYLQRFAVQQSKKGINVVRVLVDTDTPSSYAMSLLAWPSAARRATWASRSLSDSSSL